jgi:hypothetical protein
MDKSNDSAIPKARQENLLIRRLENETIVYDRSRDKAYCLNGMVASVWDACDGRRTVKQISDVLKQEIDPSVDMPVVWLAIKHLDKYSLLEKEASTGFQVPAISRRNLVRSGLYAAMALPVIAAISAPTAAEAASAISLSTCRARKQFPAGSGCLATPCDSSAPANTFCKGIIGDSGNQCNCLP